MSAPTAGAQKWRFRWRPGATEGQAFLPARAARRVQISEVRRMSVPVQISGRRRASGTDFVSRRGHSEPMAFQQVTMKPGTSPEKFRWSHFLFRPHAGVTFWRGPRTVWPPRPCPQYGASATALRAAPNSRFAKNFRAQRRVRAECKSVCRVQILRPPTEASRPACGTDFERPRFSVPRADSGLYRVSVPGTDFTRGRSCAPGTDFGPSRRSAAGADSGVPPGVRACERLRRGVSSFPGSSRPPRTDEGVGA
jgi:hypothetical protein